MPALTRVQKNNPGISGIQRQAVVKAYEGEVMQGKPVSLALLVLRHYSREKPETNSIAYYCSSNGNFALSEDQHRVMTLTFDLLTPK